MSPFSVCFFFIIPPRFGLFNNSRVSARFSKSNIHAVLSHVADEVAFVIAFMRSVAYVLNHLRVVCAFVVVDFVNISFRICTCFFNRLMFGFHYSLFFLIYFINSVKILYKFRTYKNKMYVNAVNIYSYIKIFIKLKLKHKNTIKLGPYIGIYLPLFIIFLNYLLYTFELSCHFKFCLKMWHL